MRRILSSRDLQCRRLFSLASQSLFAIVITSVLLGCTLPFGLARLGVDPANAGTTIQVVMDCVGVAITCAVADLVLERLSHVFA